MDEFIIHLRRCFEQPLPASNAHDKLMPITGKTKSNKHKNVKRSGVMVLFYPRKKTINLIFIKRPVYDGVHSNQISFPGGKTEPQDKSLTDTALRETNEELGIEKKDIIVIDSLSDIFVYPSNNLVTPFLGVHKKQPLFKPDKREVKKLIEVPLSEILKEDNLSKAVVKAGDGFMYKVPCFIFDNNIIWGATAMILNEVIHLLNR